MRHYSFILLALLSIASSCEDMLEYKDVTAINFGDPVFRLEETNFHIGSKETIVSTKFNTPDLYYIRAAYCDNIEYSNLLPPPDFGDDLQVIYNNWNYVFDSSIISGCCDKENVSITVSENTTGFPRKIEVSVDNPTCSKYIVIEQD